MHTSGSHGWKNTRHHGNADGTEHDPHQGEWMDDRRNFGEVVNGRIEYFLAGQSFDHPGNSVDVVDEDQSANEPRSASDKSKKQTVGEEDAHHATSGRAQSFERADVSCFFNDDHEECRKDSEPGDGDDQKQQDIQDHRFQADR